MNYILENGKPKAEPSIMAWAKWFESFNNRIVEKTQTSNGEVSTVFLGIDHSFTEGAKPVLWETMVFGGPLDQECERYTSLGDAKQGHMRWVEKLELLGTGKSV